MSRISQRCSSHLQSPIIMAHRPGGFWGFRRELQNHRHPRPLVWVLISVNCFALALCLESSAEDLPGTHNMLVIGEKTIFLSHLPMFGKLDSSTTGFDSVHRYQAILQATFTKAGDDPQSIYKSDRKHNPKIRIYTLEPEDFILPRLAEPASKNSISSFQGTVFRGHLERGGHKIRDLQDIQVNVTRVILFHEMHPDSQTLPKLEYVLFGKGEELFLAHRITKPPDFDQILSVQVPAHAFSDTELAMGIRVMIPERSNSAEQRVLTNQEVEAACDTSNGKSLTTMIRALGEIYFEQGELFSPPTFRRTSLERKAHF